VKFLKVVIPVKAGIHFALGLMRPRSNFGIKVDSRFRGNDDILYYARTHYLANAWTAA